MKRSCTTMRQSRRDDVYSQYREFVISEQRKACITLLRDVQERFVNQPDKSTRFRRLLNDCSNKRIDVASLGVEISKLFSGNDDLILKFKAFLPQDYDEEANDDDETTAEEGGDGGGGDGLAKVLAAINFMNKVNIRFQNDGNIEELRQIIKLIKKIQQGQSLHEQKNKVVAIFHEHGYGDLIEEFHRVVSDSEATPSVDDYRSATKDRKQKHIVQSMQELDLFQCKQVSPSYWLLPKNYSTPLASNRSEIAAQVLNDNIVCVSPCSGNYSDKRRERKQQEEILFRCEDDRFELDMLLEFVISAATRVQKLVNRIERESQNNEESCSIKIKGNLSVADLRCIERLYGDYGLDVIDNLHRNPEVALPVILKRLKQKHAELIECRSDFNKVWVQVCAHNQDNHDELNNLRTEDMDDDQLQNIDEKDRPMIPNSKFPPLDSKKDDDL